MLKKLLLCGGTRKQHVDDGRDTSSPAPQPQRPAEPTPTPPPAAASPALPQLELTTPILASDLLHEDEPHVSSAPTKITPTPRPPIVADETEPSASAKRLPQLQVVSPTVTLSLTPPTPVDAPPSPASPPRDTARDNLLLSLQHPASPGSSAGSKRRTSSQGSQNRTFKETLNAYAVEENGQRMVNQYRLDSSGSLGRGSYATVERATDRETGIEYAIKEFSKRRLRQIAASEAARRERSAARGRGRGRGRGRPTRPSAARPEAGATSDTEGPDNLDLIKTEVAIMKKVHHPNIAYVHEVIDVTSDDALLLVLELCAGGPILRIPEGGQVKPLTEQQAREVFQQLVLGVAYLHHNHIVHRDIKPDNCLFMADMEQVKLIDFGISRFQAQDADSDAKGSPAFMAPELLPQSGQVKEGRRREDMPCDMWALGATLFALVCGRLPFDSPDPPELFRAIREDNPQIPSKLSAPLQHLIRRMLDKDPETRITAPELWDDPWISDGGKQALIKYDDNCIEFAEPTASEVDKALNSLRASTFIAMSVVAKLKGMRRRSFSDGGSPSRSARSESIIDSPTSSPRLKPDNSSSNVNGAGQNGKRQDTLGSISTFESALTLSSPPTRPTSVKTDEPALEPKTILSAEPGEMMAEPEQM